MESSADEKAALSREHRSIETAVTATAATTAATTTYAPTDSSVDHDHSSGTDIEKDVKANAHGSSHVATHNDYVTEQQNGLDIERVPTHVTQRSILSRISKRKTKPDGIPPPTIPVTDLDKGIVGWDSQDDPAMPLNFTPTRKWLMMGLLSLITFMTPFASSILAPAILFIADQYELGIHSKAT